MKWKLLLYCTKAKPTLYNVLGKFITTKYMGKDFKQDGLTHPELDGKIVAECDYEAEEITIGRSYGFAPNLCIISTKNLQPIELLSKSCYESYDDLFKYLKYDFDNDYGNHKGPYGYAIHIKNLHIFDTPLELNNFLYEDDTDGHYGVWEVERTPANYTIISTDAKDIGGVYCCRGTYGRFLALSSLELCDILNDKKTIVVRKRISKEML